ncbi:MAG: hypothetical protein RMJ82_10300 [Gemmatales bacterium]|nr:hypothetical protein [Gemmatales bacterium]
MRSKHYTTLRVEQLDDRITPDVGTVLGGAGNVQAYLSGGNLYIIGDGANNRLALWNVTPNAIRIQGNVTTINGSPTAQVFALGAGRSVFINLRGGDDRIVLGDNLNDDDNRSLSILGNLRIDLGNGDNTVGLENLYVGGTTTVRALGGNDFLDIDTTLGQPSFFKGNVSSTLGAGTNIVTGSTFGIGGNLSLTTGDDDDTINLANATVAKNLLIAANDGDNNITITDSDVNGNITRISTGVGDDDIELDSSDFKRLFIVAGDGANNVDVGVAGGGVTAVSVSVTTGEGADTVNITDSDFQLASSVSTGDDDDTINVSGSDFSPGGLTVDGGAGSNDTFTGLASSLGNNGLISLNFIEIDDS